MGGGMHGFWGHVWFYLGVCMVLFGGHVWFYLGGACMFYLGGMHGFSGGDMHGFSSFFGYNEIRSMSGRYASYWNAFLFWNCNVNQKCSLPTAKEGNVFTGVCQSFCSQLASWLLSHCSSFLWRGRYASYWNAFLFQRKKFARLSWLLVVTELVVSETQYRCKLSNEVCRFVDYHVMLTHQSKKVIKVERLVYAIEEWIQEVEIL